MSESERVTETESRERGTESLMVSRRRERGQGDSDRLFPFLVIVFCCQHTIYHRLFFLGGRLILVKDGDFAGKTSSL